MNPPGHREPPLEAYSRVTAPERYRVLHEVATDVIDQLELTFEVDRAEGVDLAPDLPGRAVNRAVRLTPRTGDAGALTISLTDFPGVVVSYGGGFQMSFPHCGCDACDENPRALADELRNTVDSLAAGALWEGVEGDCYAYRLGGLSSRGVVAEDDPVRALPPSKQWAGWLRR